MLNRREVLRRGLLTASAFSVPALISTSTGPVYGAVAAEASFQGLGELPYPGAEEAATIAWAVSGDGSAVVGQREIIIPVDQAYMTLQQAFLWTISGGYELLGEPNPNQASATAASFDGSVAVGYIGYADGGFRWTAEGGLQQLPMNTAADVSADGSVVLGGNFRWTEAGGPVSIGTHGIGYGLSADGQAATGSLRNHAMRWTAATGIRAINTGRVWESLGRDISGDGLVVVGQAMFRRWAPWHAFRWTAARGMVDLGTLGGPQSWAWSTNSNGSVVVGVSEGTPSRGGAFRWTAGTGMRNVRAELLKAGVSEVRNWSLVMATGVSADGTVIVGWGRNPAGRREAFRAVLPLPRSARERR